MKIVLIAATAMALAGTGIASAQTSVGADVDLNARNTTHAGAHATVHKRKHHTTTGAAVRSGIETRDNNASAKGSLLPGKDRDFSEKYIGAK
jgi:hypothetical protein